MARIRGWFLAVLIALFSKDYVHGGKIFLVYRYIRSHLLTNNWASVKQILVLIKVISEATGTRKNHLFEHFAEGSTADKQI